MSIVFQVSGWEGEGLDASIGEEWMKRGGLSDTQQRG